MRWWLCVGEELSWLNGWIWALVGFWLGSGCWFVAGQWVFGVLSFF